MRIGCFQLHEPVPELHEPYVLACLRPWIDVNGVGSLVLNEVEARLGAMEMGALSRPGRFYDFTRYRPIIHLEDGIRDFSIPNTPVHYAVREGRNDVVLLRLLEPHAHAEHYVDSILKLFKTVGAKKYILLGSMHDMVPHTRPLIVSGYGMGKEARKDVRKAGALPVIHHGPSTIVNLVQQKAAAAGMIRSSSSSPCPSTWPWRKITWGRSGSWKCSTSSTTSLLTGKISKKPWSSAG